MKDMLSLRKEIVMVHLGKESFPPGKHVKIKPEVHNPFKLLLRIGENAYKIELPDNYAVSPTFNLSNLSPFHASNSNLDSRMSLFHPEGLDTAASFYMV